MRTRKSNKPAATATTAPAISAPATVAAPAVVAKAKAEIKKHDIKLSYTGPSPTVRGHGHKLSAVRLDIGAKTVTERDETFIRDIRAKYAQSPFKRYDCDAGNVRRAVAHGFLVHVSGDLGSRECELRVTKLGAEYGAKPAVAPKA